MVGMEGIIQLLAISFGGGVVVASLFALIKGTRNAIVLGFVLGAVLLPAVVMGFFILAARAGAFASPG